MFSFFRRSPPRLQSRFNFIGADMHNHLLPGIDDGSPDVDTSLRFIEAMMELGYSKFICTPHVLSDVHPNTPETISTAWQQLSNGAKEKGLNCQLMYSAEYMLNFDFDNLLAKGIILPFGNNQVLIEMSYAVESPNIKDAIFQLQTKGYKPILAHPERYPYYFHNLTKYEDFIYAGCEFQINMLSLTGYYGKPIKKIAEKLIEKGWISWLGTDLHHDRHLAALIQMSNDSKMLKQLDKIKKLNNPSLLEIV